MCAFWIYDQESISHEAIASVLSGETNPSGKPTETFANFGKDCPSENISFDGLNYNFNKGMDVGYRYFNKYPKKIRFPFGYGLSYTKFVCSDLQVQNDENGCVATFTVSNVGEKDGTEVSLVYVKALDLSPSKSFAALLRRS